MTDIDKPGRGALGRRGLAAAGLLLAARCSPLQVLNDVAPRRRVATGLAYAGGERHRLDVYAPDASGRRRDGAPAPVIVFVYGGNWDSGSRAMYGFVGGALAAGGAVAIIPDYRLYPAVRFPDFLCDCALAVRWAADHADAYGGGGPLFLMGHSAGAYNVAMLGLDPGYLAAVGIDRRRLHGVIGLAGPYDFLPLDTDELQDIFGPPRLLARTQPVNFVDAEAPPMLLCTGGADVTVRPSNTERLAARLRAVGRPVAERIYPGIGHREIIGAIAGPLRFLAPTLRDTLAYVGLGTPLG